MADPSPNMLAKLLRSGAGALETGASVGSGLLGSVPAGYMGLVELLRSGDSSKAAQRVSDTQSALTYQPRTQAGQNQTNTLASLAQYAGKPAEYIGNKAYEMTGSPGVATAANMVLDPLNYIGPGLLGKGIKGTAKAVPRMVENAMIPSQYNKQMGAIVWHGSPHKFDAFDSSKIGTGEGAQAYGHGLYLAENPSVAKEYAKLDPAGGQIPSALRFINGQEVFPGSGQYKAASLLDSMSLPQAKKTVSGWVKNARPEELPYFQEVFDTLNTIPSKSAVKQKPPGGNIYQVDLPDDQIAKMLDWDKPLSQQAPEVRAAIKKTQALLPENAMDDLGGDLSLLYGPDVTGADFLGTMNSLRPNLGEDVLRQVGLPGVRYLDGGSRGAGQGSSNFVVFPGNEGLLKILERNGQKL